MEEPSVLDYLKSKLMPWRQEALEIPPAEPLEQETDDQAAMQGEAYGGADEPGTGPMISTQVEFAEAPRGTQPATPAAPPAIRTGRWPWRALIAVGLALIAQLSLEPGPDRTWITGAGLYIVAGAIFAWAYWRREWQEIMPPETSAGRDPLTVRRPYLLIGLPLALLAFLSLGGNRFTVLNVSLWVGATAFVGYGLWLPAVGASSWRQKLKRIVFQSEWDLRLSRWTVSLLAVTAVVLFFRVYRINAVPPEMVSDHAEKLLDVWDVLHGETRIFFPRNTGREAMQMYMTAAIIRLLGTGYSHLSLKIGTVLAGLLTLPYIYSLGKEIGNRRVGLWALLFAGIAYWPNVISRVGLRFPLYALFVAPTLYYLLRGLRTANRNDFILAGLALGIGLHGYTPIRILPLLVVLTVFIYLLHRQSAGRRRQVIYGLVVLAVMALMVFLPLLRFWLENPEIFVFRSLSRLGSVERPLPGPAWQIFLGNLWKALTMLAWDDGEIWVTSVTRRPAVDVVSGALFYLGSLWLIIRYFRHRKWQDIFLLLAVPLLMMPSILSLAFPGENPSLNRMSGAIVPVFLIVGRYGRVRPPTGVLWRLWGLLFSYWLARRYKITGWFSMNTNAFSAFHPGIRRKWAP